MNRVQRSVKILPPLPKTLQWSSSNSISLLLSDIHWAIPRLAVSNRPGSDRDNDVVSLIHEDRDASFALMEQEQIIPPSRAKTYPRPTTTYRENDLMQAQQSMSCDIERPSTVSLLNLLNFNQSFDW